MESAFHPESSLSDNLNQAHLCLFPKLSFSAGKQWWNLIQDGSRDDLLDSKIRSLWKCQPSTSNLNNIDWKSSQGKNK